MTILGNVDHYLTGWAFTLQHGNVTRTVAVQAVECTMKLATSTTNCYDNYGNTVYWWVSTASSLGIVQTLQAFVYTYLLRHQWSRSSQQFHDAFSQVIYFLFQSLYFTLLLTKPFLVSLLASFFCFLFPYRAYSAFLVSSSVWADPLWQLLSCSRSISDEALICKRVVADLYLLMLQHSHTWWKCGRCITTHIRTHTYTW